jgi:hypothetical protein
MRNWSRRGFGGLLLAFLFPPPRLNGQTTTAGLGTPAQQTTVLGTPLTSAHSISRTYRADAVILLLGLSIYRRAGVGGGRASVEETGEGPSLRRAFFFAGGSDAKRAHGLSRVGWMQEVVHGLAVAPSDHNYFGVLTASPEDTLEHARKSAAAAPSGSSVFSAVSGKNTAGHSRSAVTHFEFAANAMWSDRGLIDHAQSTFEANVDWRETSWPNSPTQAPPTFLFQLATLLKQRTRQAKGRFVYDEQEYLLDLETQPPARGAEHLLPVHGVIRNLRTAHEVPFRVWLEKGGESVVPLRIEFQPRSFLRLTFEAVSA